MGISGRSFRRLARCLEARRWPAEKEERRAAGAFSSARAEIRQKAFSKLISARFAPQISPGAGEGKRRKLKRGACRRPTVEAVDRAQQAAKLAFVGDRRSGFRIRAQQRTLQGIGGAARRSQRDDRRIGRRSRLNAAQPARGIKISQQ